MNSVLTSVPPIALRPYQAEAIAAVYAHLRTRNDHPCIVIPTAGGKTPIMASICRDAVKQWNGRVLILAHVKELLEQAADKLHAMAPDLWHQIGIYSAGLKSRDTDHSIIIAGIQSVYRRAAELGPFDLILIDEAHMLPPDGEGMYRTFLTDALVVNPNVRLVGLTATPYRMSTGLICSPENLLNHVCFEVGVRELILQGFLCPLKTKAGRQKADTSELHVRAGEFVAGEVEDLMDQEQLVKAACGEIVEQTRTRNSVLIFASSVRHGQHVVETFEREHKVECGFVEGETPADQREATLKRFREGKLKFLTNVNVLTTGFDAPNIDCVVLLRPTMSPGLYAQMTGRGFRLFAGKSDCLVLDFGGNVVRHGPVDQIKVTATGGNTTAETPAKECPQCQALIHAAYSRCPECGFEFPPPQRQKHDSQASTAGILSGQQTDTRYAVTSVHYGIHTKRGAGPDTPRTMRVDYEVGFRQYKSEWICFEHAGFTRQKAELWWKKRSAASVPHSIDAAVALASAGALASTHAVIVRSITGDPYDRIVDYKLGEKPPWDAADDPATSEVRRSNGASEPGITLDDIPF